jgi:Ser/Thr protein kinase RdoA (MazF antagonist)
VQCSILSSQALAELVLASYSLQQPLRCALLQHGDNDTYLLVTGHDRYILRVWRRDERPIAEVEAEMRLLADLRSRQLPVAAPMQRSDGGYVQAVRAPEGTRFVGLFAYAAGEGPGRNISAEHAVAAGKAIANVHTVADRLTTLYQRPHLDLTQLLDVPLATVLPLLSHRQADVAYLESLVDQLKHQLDQLPLDQPFYGLCHGDLHKTNMLFDQQQRLTLIDFDCCGYGWRAYELAVLFWSTRHLPQAAAVRAAFLDGYQTVRALDVREVAAIPYFVAAQHIVITAVEVEQAMRGVADSQTITDSYLDDRIYFLKMWMAAVQAESYFSL